MKRKVQKKEVGRIGKFRNYIIGGICAVLAAVSILLTIDVASSGVEMASLEKSQSQLTEQKRSLEESLVKNLSNSELQEKSDQLGFVKPANLVYVSEVPPVAQLP